MFDYLTFRRDISDLFSTTCRSSAVVMGSVVGLEGGTSLHRVSSMRRGFASSGAGIKRRSVSLQVKFQMVGSRDLTLLPVGLWCNNY